MLREEWNLGDKNRLNHFHHAEDAIIIAFTNRAIYMDLAQHRKKEKTKGKFYHPWGISEFKEKFNQTIMNIAVFDKQRNRKITEYKKTIQLRGKKERIKIQSVRGQLNEANPYGKLKQQDIFTSRKAFTDLSNENWKNNIPKDVHWVPLEEQVEKRQLKSVKLAEEEKKKTLSKLLFSDVAKIEDEIEKTAVENRLAEKRISNPNTNEPIPLGSLDKLSVNVNAKGKGDIKKCQVLLNEEDEPENRKLVRGQKNLLLLNEVNFITDEAIKAAVINRLNEIVDETEALKNEYGKQAEIIIKAINDKTFDVEENLPQIFFDKKLRRGLRDYGIPIKKATFIEKKDGKRQRKRIEDLTFGDIEKITEPTRTIIKKRLETIDIEIGKSNEKLPKEFYAEGIFVPVKNIQTHYDGIDLYPIRNGAYFRFGNTDSAIIQHDSKRDKYYVEAIPFYFVINPHKYTDDERLKCVYRIGETDINQEREENNLTLPDITYYDLLLQIIKRLKPQNNLRKGDYFILNMDLSDVEKYITSKLPYKLQENLYKVSMISATSFDIEFRKHSVVKSNEGEIHVTSSDKWKGLKPIKVEVTKTGEIKLK